ncbi:hypothetical protein LIER_00105 [Lithospermum erythrorhizon]|uniref:non-specific serine/threonine protein kinase n=1 Tax=Lithospermum erythrorhizon TaxID=34254 RepID=A0AAV3NG77_LITER
MIDDCYVSGSGEVVFLQNARYPLGVDSSVPGRAWEQRSFQDEYEEFMPGTASFTDSDASFEYVGTNSFHGVSHPQEPIDTHCTRQLYVAIDQNEEDNKCSIKSLFVKGPLFEDVPVHVPGIKPAESLDEEPSDLGPIAFPFIVPYLSENAEITAVSISEEKGCIRDPSLPPIGNVSPHRSISRKGVVRAMSIASSCTSTYRGDGMLRVDRNDEGNKGSIRGDSLDSGDTSVGRTSDSSGLSDDSNWSTSTGSANKPHHGNDPRWKAILAIKLRDGVLDMRHFKLLRKLGCGSVGSVYLSELSGTRCCFAMKVINKASLETQKRRTRAQTEREILQLLDHPFLPTLYTHFESDRFSCLVMEYCPGGDLHTLRKQKPGKHFSENAARFYAAEVLLALEYLHMLGVVYRDLKPENVLLRDDGHIMLSNFDLSLLCAASPTLIETPSTNPYPFKQGLVFCVQLARVEPTYMCSQPACFFPRLFSQKIKRKLLKARADSGQSASILPELLAEPNAARSMSFVGTHEYLAPEIIKGEGHGSAVDWWTFGIFLHELLYGRTPFKGSSNRATLLNVVGQQLKFRDSSASSYAARDLIRGLLVKEPQHRLGTKKGATDIKQHPFFKGVNWALIRCSTPPNVPRPVDAELPSKSGQVKSAGVRGGSNKYLDFEFF